MKPNAPFLLALSFVCIAGFFCSMGCKSSPVDSNSIDNIPPNKSPFLFTLWEDGAVFVDSTPHTGTRYEGAFVGVPCIVVSTRVLVFGYDSKGQPSIDTAELALSFYNKTSSDNITTGMYYSSSSGPEVHVHLLNSPLGSDVLSTGYTVTVTQVDTLGITGSLGRISFPTRSGGLAGVDSGSFHAPALR